MKVKPLGDRVLVKRLEAKEVVSGGIIIPDTAKEKSMEAKVISLGAGRVSKDGTSIGFDVKVGDKVLITKYGGQDIKIDGEDYMIMREDDIMAIV